MTARKRREAKAESRKGGSYTAALRRGRTNFFEGSITLGIRSEDGLTQRYTLSHRPLLLVGIPGSGKTAILRRAIQDLSRNKRQDQILHLIDLSYEPEHSLSTEFFDEVVTQNSPRDGATKLLGNLLVEAERRRRILREHPSHPETLHLLHRSRENTGRADFPFVILVVDCGFRSVSPGDDEETASSLLLDLAVHGPSVGIIPMVTSTDCPSNGIRASYPSELARRGADILQVGHMGMVTPISTSGFGEER